MLQGSVGVLLESCISGFNLEASFFGGIYA